MRCVCADCKTHTSVTVSGCLALHKSGGEAGVVKCARSGTPFDPSRDTRLCETAISVCYEMCARWQSPCGTRHQYFDVPQTEVKARASFHARKEWTPPRDDYWLLIFQLIQWNGDLPTIIFEYESTSFKFTGGNRVEREAQWTRLRYAQAEFAKRRDEYISGGPPLTSSSEPVRTARGASALDAANSRAVKAEDPEGEDNPAPRRTAIRRMVEGLEEMERHDIPVED